MTGALIHLALKCKWLNKSANSAADEQENSAADESALGVLPPRIDPLRMDPPWENPAADEIRPGTIRRGFVTESTQIRTQCYFHQLRNISSV